MPKGVPGRAICRFPDCDAFVSAYGLCSGHRAQEKRGQALEPLEMRFRFGPAARHYDSVPEGWLTCTGWCGLAYPVSEFRVHESGRVRRRCSGCHSLESSLNHDRVFSGQLVQGWCFACGEWFSRREGKANGSVYLGVYCSGKCKNRANRNRREYGLEPRDYWRMFHEQAGMCAMPRCFALLDCSAPVDHCHDFGHVRGLLCVRCNLHEGQWREAERLGVREYLGEPDPAELQRQLDEARADAELLRACLTVQQERNDVQAERLGRQARLLHSHGLEAFPGFPEEF